MRMDKLYQALALWLPRRFAYWVAIRVLAGATFTNYQDWLEQMAIARVALDQWRDAGNDDNWPEYKGRFRWRK